MKSIEYLINKYSYNDDPVADMPDSNTFYQEDPDPYNQYYPPGEIKDNEDYGDQMGNRQRDGNEFEEFKEFRKKRKLERIKKLLKLRKKKKKNVFQPTPFYSSEYGYTGFEGAMTSPLEYYSGSIMDEPGAITNNPYNNTYQQASDRSERIKIRGMIFKDYIRKG